MLNYAYLTPIFPSKSDLFTQLYYCLSLWTPSNLIGSSQFPKQNAVFWMYNPQNTKKLSDKFFCNDLASHVATNYIYIALETSLTKR